MSQHFLIYRWTISQHAWIRVDWFQDKTIRQNKVPKVAILVQQFEMLQLDDGWMKNPHWAELLVPILILQQHGMKKGVRGVRIYCIVLKKGSAKWDIGEDHIVQLTPEEVTALPFLFCFIM